MKKHISNKAITTAAILAATYAIVSALSVYSVMPILSVFSLMVMPIFAAYFASVFSFKETLLFNITTIVLCFLVAIIDPLYTILYVVPTLIVGDLFGVFTKMKLKYFTTMFLQTITYSITNFIALYLAEYFYDIQIISVIISDEWIYKNLSLSILFILSGAEAVFSSLFISEQLKKVSIIKIKEREMPLYGYVTFVGLFLLAILFYFLSNNFYFLMVLMMAILCIPILSMLIKKIKHFDFLLLGYVIVMITVNFALCYFDLMYVIPLAILLPFMVYCLIKSIKGVIIKKK